MSSGLDALKNRGRGERKKPIPPPLHAPRTTPVEAPEPASDDASSQSDVNMSETRSTVVEQPVQAEEHSRQIAPDATSAQASVTTAQPSNVVTAEHMRKKTVSLGAAEEAFIQKVVVAGMLSPAGKVDSNQSATIRLALRRLQAEMTPEQIAEEIRQGLNKTGESGRPRF